jgi:hypothetical protein
MDMFFQTAGRYISGYASPFMNWFSNGFKTPKGITPQINTADAVGNPCTGCGDNFAVPNGKGYIFMTQNAMTNTKDLMA